MFTYFSRVHQMFQGDDASTFALVVAEQIVLGLHGGGAGGGDGGAGRLPAQGSGPPVLLLHLPGGAASLGGDGDLRDRARVHHRRSGSAMGFMVSSTSLFDAVTSQTQLG